MSSAGELAEQLSWHWENQARPRLEGLTDAEYFWEPVSGCWSLRPREEAAAPVAAGVGRFVLEYAVPAPEPAPVTTIAWRLCHLIVGVLGERVGSHFGGEPITYRSFDYPETAGAALARLDGLYEQWTGAVSGLSGEELARPVGPAEGPFAEYPMSALVLHINREMIHHLAEVALLRDLYRDGPAKA